MGIFQSLRDLFSGGGRTPAELAKWLDLPESELLEWRKGMPTRAEQFSYSTFEIPKRNGGARTIEAPSPKLKTLQRRILKRLLNPLKAHASATGFVRGRSIVDNARPHVGQGVVTNLDLKDFFHSIKSERVTASLRGIGWGKDAATILVNICTHQGRLPQGAPTSPALSNLVCRKLDNRLFRLTEKVGGNYTRYADDLCFSFTEFRPRIRGTHIGSQRRNETTNLPSRAVLKRIGQILKDEGFEIQKKKKVRILRAHQRQTATGLVVNQTVNLPREVRRKIRAMQHRERLGQLTANRKAQLRGLEGFQKMVTTQRDRAAR